MREDIEVIGTASLHWLPPTHSPRQHLAGLARRAEENGFTGLLVFYDHMVLDPWTVAGVLLQNTTSLVPVSRCSLTQCRRTPRPRRSAA